MISWTNVLAGVAHSQPEFTAHTNLFSGMIAIGGIKR